MKAIILFGELFSLLFLASGQQQYQKSMNVSDKDFTLLRKGTREKNGLVTVSCICKGRRLQEHLPLNILKTDINGMDFSKYCEKKHTAICDSSCGNCTFEKRVPFPLQKIISSGRYFYGSSRNRRNLASNCPFPTDLKTAELDCHAFSKYITCKQMCLFGYTLPEGISRQMKCYYSKKKWDGPGFQECLPFVDCTLKFMSGGQASCVKNTLWSAPHCNVSCAAYEDKPAVPFKTYTCTTEPYKWKPDLPHCVIAGSGFELSPAPKIKLHSQEVPDTKYKKSRRERAAQFDIEHKEYLLEEVGNQNIGHKKALEFADEPESGRDAFPEEAGELNAKHKQIHSQEIVEADITQEDFPEANGKLNVGHGVANLESNIGDDGFPGKVDGLNIGHEAVNAEPDIGHEGVSEEDGGLNVGYEAANPESNTGEEVVLEEADRKQDEDNLQELPESNNDIDEDTELSPDASNEENSLADEDENYQETENSDEEQTK